MKIIVAIAFYFLYWGVCFLGTGTDKKNLMGLRSYPEEVQNRVRSDHQLGKAVPKRKSTAAVWLSNLLLFTVVFSALGLALRGVLNLDGYLSAFWYFLAFSEGLGLFDLLVIDLLWWRNTKRTRFSFLPGCKDAPSQQPLCGCPRHRQEIAKPPTQDLPKSPVKALLVPPVSVFVPVFGMFL